MPVPEMNEVPDHHPQRGDQVHLWLKNVLGTASGDVEYGALETAIAEYESAADNMLSLGEVVNGVQEPPPGRIRKKKRSIA